MMSIHILALAGIALTVPSVSRAQVAGSTVIGIGVAGWCAKRQNHASPQNARCEEMIGLELL